MRSRIEGLSIGALVTHTEIMRSPLIRDLFPALVDAAHTIGAVQTRNLGTLGGNLVTGVPSMDSGPTLVALDALVTVAGPAGRRQMPLAEFFVGSAQDRAQARRTAGGGRHPQGQPRQARALPEIRVAQGAGAGARQRRREPVDRTGDKHASRTPRIALGAVAPTVIRAPAAEAFLEGRAVTPEAMAEAGRIAAGEAKPISDFRASAEYRRDLVAVLTRRALDDALRGATAERKEKRK